MNTRDNTATYRAIIAAVSAGDLDRLDQLIAHDLVDHNPAPGQPPGLDGFKHWANSARLAFPDLTGSVEDTLADDDKIAGRVTWHGSHRGDLAGVPGTGARVQFSAFHIVRFSAGLAVEWWGTADLLGALVQAGATVSLPSARDVPAANSDNTG
jgi:predicted ester cyclase